MLIKIASLNVCTFYPFASSPSVDVELPDRGDDEKIEHYAERIFSEKVNVFKTGLSKAVNNSQRKGECLFFSMPEFYWNLSPYAFWSKEDVAGAAEYYMDHIPDIITRVIEDYPVGDFGKIILLCGSAGTLIETEKNYDAINYLLAIDNFNFNADGTHCLSMWQKSASREYGPSVQYAIRNDGYGGTLEKPHAGGCDVMVVESGHITRGISPLSVEDDVYFYELEVV